MNGETPRTLSEIVSRLLAKNPGERFQSAEELRDILLQHLAAANQGGSDVLTETIPLPVRRRKPRRWLARTIVLLLLVALGGGAALLWHGLRPAQPAVALSGVLTVAQGQPADFQGIRQALAQAGPGAVIRVLDGAVYQGPVVFDKPEQFHDVTVEAPNGAILGNAENQDPVVTIDDTPGVVLRGLHIRARQRQHCISVRRSCEGLLVDSVSLTQPPTSSSGSLVLWTGASGSEERPIVLGNLDVHCGEIGIVIVGTSALPAAWVRIEKSRFTGPGRHVALETALRHVTLEGNIFMNGGGGIGLAAQRAGDVQQLAVTNNTFFQLTSWLALNDSSLDQAEVRFANNLILQCDQILLAGQDLAPVAPRWFHNNWWEANAATNETQARLVADVKEEVLLLSREPKNANFLRPAAGTMKGAVQDGAVHDYIGALAPAPTSLPP